MLRQDSRSNNLLNNDTDTLAYVETTIAQKNIVFKFPKQLEERFIYKRAKDSQAFIHTGRYLLVLLLFTSLPSIATSYPFVKCFSTISAVLPQAVRLCHCVSVTRSTFAFL